MGETDYQKSLRGRCNLYILISYAPKLAQNVSTWSKRSEPTGLYAAANERYFIKH